MPVASCCFTFSCRPPLLFRLSLPNNYGNAPSAKIRIANSCSRPLYVAIMFQYKPWGERTAATASPSATSACSSSVFTAALVGGVHVQEYLSAVAIPTMACAWMAGTSCRQGRATSMLRPISASGTGRPVLLTPPPCASTRRCQLGTRWPGSPAASWTTSTALPGSP